MSARQNKKQRKGRNNANNRERTVTTLTEDPNTPYLVPTPSEEPAGGHLPPSFTPNPASNPKVHIGSGPQPYQTPTGTFGGFSFGAGYNSTIPSNVQQQQQGQQQPFFPTQPNMQTSQPSKPLPPGKNDLEILQNLKKMIIENQHPFFRAVPNPAALANLYNGPLTSQPQTQGRQRSEQGAVAEYRNENGDGHTSAIATSTSGFGSDSGRRQQRTQGKDRRSQPPPFSAGGTQQNNNNQGNRYNGAGGGNLISNLGLSTHKLGKNNSGPPSAGPDPRSAAELPPSSAVSEDMPDRQGGGRYNDYSARSRSGQRPPETAPPPRRDAAYDNSGPKDDPMDGSRTAGYNGKDEMSRPGSWAPRQPAHLTEADRAGAARPGPGPPPHIDTRPTGGDRGAGPLTDSDVQGWGRQDRSRRPDRPHDQRPMDYRDRRPSAASDQRPYEAQAIARRGSDAARPPPSAADRPPPHVPDIVPPASDVRPPADFRPHPDASPALSATRPEREDLQSRASSARPVEPTGALPIPVHLGSTSTADHSIGPPSDTSRPSLQERMHPPPQQSRPVGDSAAASGDHGHPQPQHSRPQHHQNQKKGKFYKNQGGRNNHYGAGGGGGAPHHDAPPPRSGGYDRPTTPLGPPLLSGGGPRQPFRSPSLDGRSTGGKLPPSPSRARDFRGPPGPGRDVSRDRPAGGVGGGYRPDYDADVPPPARYGDRAYGGGRDYSPPPPAGERGRAGPYPASPPAGDVGPPGRNWGLYPPASGDRRDYPPEDDAYYNRPRGTWDGPPAERERYDRDYPPRTAGWDARSDRDFGARDAYPPGPPPPDDRYSDRSRPPPGGYPAASYNRVRPRSASPPMRRAGPAVDDPRPPLKRPREDYPPPADYYPPGGRDGGGRRGPNEYPPPRSGSPSGPPPSSASSWPSSTGGPSAGGPPTAGPLPDRDYRAGGYPPPPTPAGYERPRSPPGPSGGRGSYSNRGGGGGYGRDGGRGGYGMPPPRP